MDGWTSVLVRTERGRLAFQAARSKLDVRGLDDPAALLRLDALDKKIANRSLQRKLDPDAPLFIDFDEHVRAYDGTDRQPVVHPPLTVTDRHPVLHVPDEPWRGPRHGRTSRSSDRPRPRRRARGGAETASASLALVRAGGRSASVGMTEDGFERLVVDYRREIWLWLAGERTWAQCCSGLIGRIDRRLARLITAGGEPSRPAVTLRGVDVRRDGVAMLDRIDWQVQAGERWVVLGPNGSGKTTMLQVAGARLWPTSGRGRGAGRAAGPGRRADAAAAGGPRQRRRRPASSGPT